MRPRAGGSGRSASSRPASFASSSCEASILASVNAAAALTPPQMQRSWRSPRLVGRGAKGAKSAARGMLRLHGRPGRPRAPPCRYAGARGDARLPMPSLAARAIGCSRSPGSQSLLVIPAEAHAAALDAVREAEAAVVELGACRSSQVDAFFLGFADRLADPRVWDAVTAANQIDVQQRRGPRPGTSRLRVSEKMRAAMIDGLRGWAKTPSRIGEVLERRRGDGFVIERRAAPLGVVAFVFEGRPNVFADGAGVVRNGNAAVMRIGGDALDTALAIEEHALRPALGGGRAFRSGPCGFSGAANMRPGRRSSRCRRSGSRWRAGRVRPSRSWVPSPSSTASPRRFTARAGRGCTWSRPPRPRRSRTCCAPVSTGRCATPSTCSCSTAGRVASLGPVCERVLRSLGARVHVARGSEGVVGGETPAGRGPRPRMGVGVDPRSSLSSSPTGSTRRPRCTTAIARTSSRRCSRVARAPSRSSTRASMLRTWATRSRAGSMASGHGTVLSSA